MSTTYQLVIMGVAPGGRIDEVAQSLALAMKVPAEKLRTLIAQRQVTFRRGIDFQTAAKSAAVFEQCGCVCVVQPESRPAANPRTGEPLPAPARAVPGKPEAATAGRSAAHARAETAVGVAADALARVKWRSGLDLIRRQNRRTLFAAAAFVALLIAGVVAAAIDWSAGGNPNGGQAKRESGSELSWSKRIEQFMLTLKPGIYRCDVLAASPHDATRVADPVEPGTVDAPAAISACRSAVAKAPENARLQYQLGRVLEYGRQPGEAFAAYKRAAEQGHVVAQHNLGILYVRGEGTAPDVATGLAWIGRALAQDFGYAYLTLGLAYKQGTHVPRNDALAVEYLHRAAELGLAKAQGPLAGSYFDGRGVAANEAEGFAWAAKAANQGELEGYYLVGYAYLHGRGVAKEPAQAKEWLERAAAQGHHGAEHFLGMLWLNGEGVPKNAGTAAEWIRKAAEGGWIKAQTQLADLYEEGNGVPKDPAKAVEWHSKAAAAGDAYALYSLGWAHEHGKGVPRDATKARSYYQQAAAGGSRSAQERLDKLDRPQSNYASAPDSYGSTGRQSMLCQVNPAACQAIRRNNEIRAQVQSQRCAALQNALSGTMAYEYQMRKAGCL